MAYTFGPRNHEICRRLLSLLFPFQIGLITIDDWGSYAIEVPNEMHLTGKIFTSGAQNAYQAIRSQNDLFLSFR